MNLMDLFIKIGVEDNASSKVASITKKLGSGLKTAAKIGTAAVAAAGTAIVKVATDAIKSYAEYEQLAGGVKKLFGDQDMKAVIANADKAYKTAGMSANKYLETTTSFAASLIKGLNGDTAKAAEYADKAIRDMSDNANTFGTDISMIQNAYQGFAKQNYTMLDNLKLGYGGTASEMARLINDSGVLGDTVTVTASNINRVSFDKIVEAINVTQNRMGILGTTTNEASTTIEGSIKTMNGAWENLKVAMVSDTEDIDQRINEFVESVGIVGDNLMPRISKVLEGVVKLVKELGPQIINELPNLVNILLPATLSAAGSLVSALINMLLDNGTNLMDTGFDMLFMLIDGLVKGITNGQIIEKIVQLVIDLALKLTDPSTLVHLFNCAVDLILALATGLIDAIPELVAAVPEIIINLATALMSGEMQYKLFEAGLVLIGSLISAIIEMGADLLNQGINLFDKLKEGFLKFVDNPKQWGRDIIDNIKNGILEKWESLKTWFSGLFNNLWGEISNTKVGKFIGGLFDKDGSHANGLSYVPFDGYIAELHKGERVLTAKEAAEYNRGVSGGATINITVNGAQYSSEESLANAIAFRIQQMKNERGAAFG